MAVKHKIQQLRSKKGRRVWVTECGEEIVDVLRAGTSERVAARRSEVTCKECL